MKTITKKDIHLPKRSKNSHKGDNGRVLIIGGSKDYVGAVALAGIAAMRSGVDWVTVATPEKVGWTIHTLTPDLVVKKIKGEYFKKEHLKEILQLEKNFDAVLIGNGMTKKAKPFIEHYVQKCTKPLVIDADGITSISLDMVQNSILTPHAKEFEILLKNSRLDVKNYRKHLKNNVLLLKGPVDTIVTKTEIFKNTTGNAGMTKAGTGDVLAGLCVGFLAQGLSLKDSAIHAAYYNGLAGDILLKKKKGFTYLASDLAEEIQKLL